MAYNNNNMYTYIIMSCEELELQTLDAQKFNLSGLIVDAKIVYVVDGDTVDAVFMFNGDYHKFRLRLYGINTPETKGPERPLGLFVKKYVNFKLLNNIVKLRLYDFDNFGRLLSTIYFKGEDFNENLVRIRYACEYDLRKSHTWDIIIPHVPFLRSMATRKLI